MTVKAVPDLAYLLSQDRWSRFFDINCTLVLATLKYMIWKILSDQPIKIITIRLIFHDFHFFFNHYFCYIFNFEFLQFNNILNDKLNLIDMVKRPFFEKKS